MLLAIETATLQAGVALIDEHGREIASRRARVTTHSEQLLSLVAAVLDDASMKPADLGRLTAIACGAGPGSFTGLRIGLATAKGLCLAIDRPLLMVSSLAALAARAPSGVIAVGCIDAFKSEVYAGFYRSRAPSPAAPSSIWQSEVDELAPESVLPPDRLAAWLAERVGEGAAVHLIGDGSARWPVLEVPGVITIDRDPPDPVHLARLAAARLARGERDDLAAAVPRYIRPSEAEINGPPVPRPLRPLPPRRP